MHLSDASSRHPSRIIIESMEFCEGLIGHALPIDSFVSNRSSQVCCPFLTWDDCSERTSALWNRRATVQNSRLQAGTVRC